MLSQNLDLSLDKKLEMAKATYLQFHSQCFWSYRKDFSMTEDDLPWIAEKLRKHGGHKGFLLAEQIYASNPISKRSI